MKDLFVAATYLELAPFLESQGHQNSRLHGSIVSLEKCDILISGIGAMLTACYLGQRLQKEKYRAIFNFGIAGSFRENLSIGSLVGVREEMLGDLGAERGDSEYEDFFEMGLIDRDAVPFQNTRLAANADLLKQLAPAMPHVRSVTVNKVLSYKESIQRIKDRYNPDIVNMEGAAVFFCAGVNQIPCMGVRAISDIVSDRERSKWRITEAVRELNRIVHEIYEQRADLS